MFPLRSILISALLHIAEKNFARVVLRMMEIFTYKDTYQLLHKSRA